MEGGEKDDRGLDFDHKYFRSMISPAHMHTDASARPEGKTTTDNDIAMTAQKPTKTRSPSPNPLGRASPIAARIARGVQSVVITSSGLFAECYNSAGSGEGSPRVFVWATLPRSDQIRRLSGRQTMGN